MLFALQSSIQNIRSTVHSIVPQSLADLRNRISQKVRSYLGPDADFRIPRIKGVLKAFSIQIIGLGLAYSCRDNHPIFALIITTASVAGGTYIICRVVGIRFWEAGILMRNHRRNDGG